MREEQVQLGVHSLHLELVGHRVAVFVQEPKVRDGIAKSTLENRVQLQGRPVSRQGRSPRNNCDSDPTTTTSDWPLKPRFSGACSMPPRYRTMFRNPQAPLRCGRVPQNTLGRIELSDMHRVRRPTAELQCRDRVFHIASASDWLAAQGGGEYRISTRGRTVEQEGSSTARTPIR